jgi:hypothetical protein
MLLLVIDFFYTCGGLLFMPDSFSSCAYDAFTFDNCLTWLLLGASF